MAENQVKTETPEVLVRAKGFWDRYSKRIIIAGLALIVLGGAYFGYKYFYKVPREEKASELIFPAEKLFGKMATTSSYNKDTVNTILNGGNLEGSAVTGLLKIISNYDGTPAGNRAQYMTGACYLQLKQFDKAVKYLKAFDGNGANQVQSKAYILLGHAYAELKKTDDALSYYKKAASVVAEDEGMTTEALYIAGMYADAMGKTKDAIELFQKIKDDFPASQKAQSGDVDKYLAKLGVTK